jgi:hypothetical protein
MSACVRTAHGRDARLGKMTGLASSKGIKESNGHTAIPLLRRHGITKERASQPYLGSQTRS